MRSPLRAMSPGERGRLVRREAIVPSRWSVARREAINVRVIQRDVRPKYDQNAVADRAGSAHAP